MAQEEFDNNVKIVRDILNSQDTSINTAKKEKLNKAISFILADQTIKISDADSSILSNVLSNNYISDKKRANKSLNTIEQLKKNPTQLRDTAKSIDGFIKSGAAANAQVLAENRATLSGEKAKEIKQNLESFRETSEIEDEKAVEKQKSKETKTKTAFAVGVVGGLGTIPIIASGGGALVVALGIGVGVVSLFSLIYAIYNSIFATNKDQITEKKEELQLKSLDQTKDDLEKAHEAKHKVTTDIAFDSHANKILNEQKDQITLSQDQIKIAELIKLQKNIEEEANQKVDKDKKDQGTKTPVDQATQTSEANKEKIKKETREIIDNLLKRTDLNNESSEYINTIKEKLDKKENKEKVDNIDSKDLKKIKETIDNCLNPNRGL